MPPPAPPLLTPAHRLRRQLLKGTLGTLVGAVAATFGWTKYLFAPLPREKTQAVSLGSVSQFQENAAPVFVTPPGMETTYAVENKGGTFRVLNAKCTHQGCPVGWDDKNGQFLCPCHAARFDRAGNVLHGPAQRPLETVSVDVRDGEVFI